MLAYGGVMAQIKPQEGWRGHFSRQPGQVRKEAALTSFEMGRCQLSARFLD